MIGLFFSAKLNVWTPPLDFAAGLQLHRLRSDLKTAETTPKSSTLMHSPATAHRGTVAQWNVAG